MLTTKFTPSWKKYEEAMHKGDAKTQAEASDKFLQEREHELKTDKQAKRWEEGRKISIAKQKPDFVKEKRRKETTELDEMRASMRKFGYSEKRLIPAPGYILIEPEVREEKTIGGIVLPEESTSAMTNRGLVVEIGNEGITNDGRDVRKPCKKHDLVLFKKGAGVEIEVQGKKCRFMQFSDILAIFEK